MESCNSILGNISPRRFTARRPTIEGDPNSLPLDKVTQIAQLITLGVERFANLDRAISTRITMWHYDGLLWKTKGRHGSR